MYMAMIPSWEVHFIIPDSSEDTYRVSERDVVKIVEILMNNGAMTIKLVKEEL